MANTALSERRWYECAIKLGLEAGCSQEQSTALALLGLDVEESSTAFGLPMVRILRTGEAIVFVSHDGIAVIEHRKSDLAITLDLAGNVLVRGGLTATDREAWQLLAFTRLSQAGKKLWYARALKAFAAEGRNLWHLR